MCNIELWIDIVVAISTFLAVIVALFGDWLKSKVFAPKFLITIKQVAGETNSIKKDDKSLIKARYYHLLIRNKRMKIANNCRVMLLNIESDIYDEERYYWKGDIPLTWEYPQLDNSIYRNIGADAFCDLLVVTEEQTAHFSTYILPNNFPRTLRGKVSLVIRIRVLSDQATSPIMTYKINWDGLWESGESEMTRHLQIKQV